MADGDTSKSLTSVVKCDVCPYIMTEPRQLNCLHHFCLSCINDIMETNQKGHKNIKCPTCQKLTPEANIQSSFIMNNLLEIYRTQNGDNTQSDNDRVCQQCDGPNPTSVCLQCNTELCEKCRERHLRFPMMKGHVIEPIELSQVSNMTVRNICPKHATYTITYNCKMCNKTGCAECMLNDHSGHKTESIEKALDTIVTSTREHMDTILVTQGHMKEKLHEIEKAIQQYPTKPDNILDAIFSYRRTLHRISFTVCENILEMIHKNAKLEKLETAKRELESELASQESLLSWTNTVINMTKGPATLCELRQGLYERVQNCATKTVVKDVNTGIPIACFLTTSKKRSWSLTNVICDLIFYALLAVVIGRFIYNSNKPLRCFRDVAINLEHFTENNLKEETNFSLRRKCTRLAYVNGTLWCPNRYENNIDVYSTDGQRLLHTMRNDHTHGVWSASPYTYKHVILATQNGLYVMTYNGKEVMKIVPGVFIDVHVNKHSIAALEWNKDTKNTIHILDIAGPGNGHTYFNLKSYGSRSILIVEDHVYVTFETLTKSFITRYTLKGKKVDQYGEYGSSSPGQLQWPLLSGYDSQQSILIADHHNHRLQVLDVHGGWRVIVPPGWGHKEYPQDVVVTTGGSVYILYRKNSKYYIHRFMLKSLK